jgi:hypothetical protein
MTDPTCALCRGREVDPEMDHLAPHTEGDALNSAMLKGEIVEQPLPSGAVALVSTDYPAIAQDELRSVAGRVRRLLSRAVD